jgi:hypothetical protein
MKPCDKHHHKWQLQKNQPYDGYVYLCANCVAWHIGRLKKNAHRSKYGQ